MIFNIERNLQTAVSVLHLPPYVPSFRKPEMNLQATCDACPVRSDKFDGGCTGFKLEEGRVIATMPSVLEESCRVIRSTENIILENGRVAPWYSDTLKGSK